MSMPGGTTIGSVVIEEKIESGASGELYLGRQPGLERHVLLRKLRRDLLGSPGLVERFRREARLAARVIHPNIVQVYDLFADHGDHYLVLEHVDGPSLRDLLERAGQVPYAIAVRVALEATRGLEEFHRRGLIHCDLRPENILISRWGEVKLSGLGYAQEIGELEPPNLPEATPYAAPELRVGERIDTKADVFSLGAVLYELLTSRPPSDEQGKRVSTRRRLSRLVRRCLNRQPASRPDLDAVRHTLERILGSSASDARMEIAAWFWEVRMRRPKLPGMEAEPALRGSSLQLLRSSAWRSLRSPRLALPIAAVLAVVTVGVLIQVGDAGVDDAPTSPASVGELPAVSSPPNPELAAAPAPKPGRVSFVAHPWAEVEVEGHVLFMTPQAQPVELPPGEHKLVLRHPHYGEVRRSLVVQAGKDQVVRHIFSKGELP